MAFDSQTRNALARLTADARSLLVDEFTRQLQTIYGIQPTGQISELESLDHLDDEQRAVAGVLRERLCHLAAGNRQDPKVLADAVARLIREQSFTVLNRFAALRMCEERGIVQQCVGADVLSKGFQVYLQTAGSGLGEQYDRYRTYLFCLFDEISLDLGVLFNRYSSCGLLFPRETALFELLAILNRKELAHVWVADEAIGWIYQYYNDPAERKKMREESAAPRNSRELAVRNQFFTPRYVVEFLSDNTLGRIWYEMTKGATALKEQCRYLVRRPTEIFLASDETPPAENQEPGTANQERTQEDLLRALVHILHRPLKDPREIRMLDPACGSMHFGLYCIDLYETLYAEAWDIAESGQVPAGADPSFSAFCLLTSDFSSKAEFLREVPRLIIEHNIHGIDIDPRAVQIAGLSLWLRAQRAWQSQGVKPAVRPSIRRSNIVCAEPMPGDRVLLREFVEREFPAAERSVCLRLLETIFDKMQLAGEAGSLLKIEEEIRSAIEDARDAWQKLATRPKELFSTEELNRISTAPELTGLEEAAASLITDHRLLTADFWERIEERLYAALRDYAEQAEHGGGFQRRLFAEDAARGFALIDICRKRYDVALMNPPFGVATDRVFEWLKICSPDTYTELFASFAARGLQMLAVGGRVGAITSRAFLTIKRLNEWRVNQVLGSIELVLDLGGAVMDSALVESCAYILQEGTVSPQIYAVDARNTRRTADTNAACDLLQANKSKHYSVNRSDLERLPGAKLLYSISPDIHELLRTAQPFEPLIGTVRQGMGTFDDFRFVHLRWEVPADKIGRGLVWEPLAKGGAYARYYSDIHLMLNWAADGRELGEVNIQHNGQVSQVRQASDYWRKSGCTYSKRSQKGFSARALPANCIITGKGPAILTLSHIPNDYLLGWLNSRLIKFLIELQANYAEFNTGILKVLPWKQPSSESMIELAREASDCALKIRSLDGTSETNSFFIGFTNFHSLTGLTATLNSQRIAIVASVAAQSYKWNQHVDTVYGVDSSNLEKQLSCDAEELNEADLDEEPLSEEQPISQIECVQLVVSYTLGLTVGRWDIRYATGEQATPELPDPFAPLPVCPPGQLQNVQGLPSGPEDVPASYPVLIPWDGILVDDPNHPLDIERRVREIIEIIWKDRAEAIEAEACEILGEKSLRAYFRKSAGFFADHLKRYSRSRRQAPLYWPLSTASGNYTLWIYYHRLTGQTLFQCVTDFLEPKIRDVSRDIERLQKDISDGGTAAQRDELDRLMDFRLELESMKSELLRVAHLPYKPDLNDGVIINAAPLWKLFRLKKWQKDCRECWEKLEAGAYDWAHLALHVWPDRVREKCRADKSLAIAHNLEELYVEQPAKPKKRAAKKQPEEELDL